MRVPWVMCLFVVFFNQRAETTNCSAIKGLCMLLFYLKYCCNVCMFLFSFERCTVHKVYVESR